jgi:hypothetical protein
MRSQGHLVRRRNAKRSLKERIMKIKWIYPISIAICLSIGSLGWAHGGASGGSASSGGSTSGSNGHGSASGHGSTAGHAATHGGMSFGHHGGLASLSSHSHFGPTRSSSHTARNSFSHNRSSVRSLQHSTRSMAAAHRQNAVHDQKSRQGS